MSFYFITDDRILLVSWANSGVYRSSGIYSIKDNNYVEDGKWLDGKVIELFDYDDNQNEVGLYVEEEIYSYKLGNSKLLFTVNPYTLQPNSDCFSQLRDGFIKINSKEDIDNIKLEERKKLELSKNRFIKKNMNNYKRQKKKY